jgi:hypothetical protein
MLTQRLCQEHIGPRLWRGALIVSGCLAFIFGACATTAPVASVAPYAPNYGYRAQGSGEKLDVTVGIVNPQLSARSALYMKKFEKTPTIQNLVSSVSATFNELMIAKGFNTKGPFASLNDMTFPDKKGSDLLLYPEFDFEVELAIKNLHTVPPTFGSTLLAGLAGAQQDVRACDITVSVGGNMVLIAQEPLSGERMWVKRLDVTQPTQVVGDQQGAICQGRFTEGILNVWRKAHETVFQTSMTAFDNYVNGEEFQMLKKQSLELRARKTY